MVTIIELPQVGESVTEGIIGKWLKSPGDKVRKYDPLVEVVTDKVTMEIPSPHTGVLARLLVSEGDTVPMGSPIAEMDLEDSGLKNNQTVDPTRRSPIPGPSFEFVESARSVGPTGSGEGGQGRPDVLSDGKGFDAPRLVVDSRQITNRPASGSRMERRTSPLIKKLASQFGLDPSDLSQIPGTGLNGRLTKRDVIDYLKGSGGEAIPARSTTERVALSPVRKLVAEQMVRSVGIPSAWTMIEVDATGLIYARSVLKESFEASTGSVLTYLPFIAIEVANALQQNPMLNARWDKDAIVMNSNVNLGIAVSTDRGLIVPVIHEADSKKMAEMAVEIDRLVKAARSNRLDIADVQGGTFTLDNTGALGSVSSVPIINHPQAAIMTTEAIVKRPVVVEGDRIEVRAMMNVCLTFDHRVFDGAEASKFLATVKSGIERITSGTLS